MNEDEADHHDEAETGLLKFEEAVEKFIIKHLFTVPFIAESDLFTQVLLKVCNHHSSGGMGPFADEVPVTDTPLVYNRVVQTLARIGLINLYAVKGMGDKGKTILITRLSATIEYVPVHVT